MELYKINARHTSGYTVLIFASGNTYAWLVEYNNGMENGLSLNTTRTVIKRRLLIGVGCAVIVFVGVILWQVMAPKPLLPNSILSQLHNFSPYFYFDRVPAGYTVDIAHANANGGLLFVPLTKQGSPTIVLTEQQMPTKLTNQDIQQGGKKVESVEGSATVNSIEGRQVGTLITSRKTLILLNGPEDTSMDDLAELLRGLKAL
jgi:hypothetical protein